MHNICVLGDGAWGTSLANLIAQRHEVRLWCYDAKVAQDITKNRVNSRYLPDIQLSSRIKPMTDILKALDAASIIIEAVPIRFLRSVLQQGSTAYRVDQIWVAASKGIEQQTLLLPTQILADVFGKQISTIALSGPSFAVDVARQQPTIMTVAGDQLLCKTVQALCDVPYITLEQSNDLLGVQVGGAFKNIIALGVGVLAGAGYADNSKIFFIMRCLKDLQKLLAFYGGSPDTILCSAGIGDIMLTALGTKSKNRSFGQLLGSGRTIAELEQQYASMPEGVNTLISLHELGKRHQQNLPVVTQLYQVVFQDNKPDSLLR